MNKVICVYVTKNKCVSTTAGNIESNDMDDVFKYFTDACNIPMEDIVELFLISNGIDGPEITGYWLTPLPLVTLLMSKVNKMKPEPISDFDLVEKELWGISDYFARKIRKDLKLRGFLLGARCWYHPEHWAVEAYALPEPYRGRYCVIDEAYVPLTSKARTWVRKANSC